MKPKIISISIHESLLCPKCRKGVISRINGQLSEEPCNNCGFIPVKILGYYDVSKDKIIVRYELRLIKKIRVFWHEFLHMFFHKIYCKLNISYKAEKRVHLLLDRTVVRKKMEIASFYHKNN